MATSLEKNAGVNSENPFEVFITPGPQHILNTLRAIADPAPEFMVDFPRQIKDAREMLIEQLNRAAEKPYYTEGDVLHVRTAAGVLSTDPQEDFTKQGITPRDVLSAQQAIVFNLEYGGVKKDNLPVLIRDYPQVGDALQVIVTRDTNQLSPDMQEMATELKEHTQAILQYVESSTRTKQAVSEI